MIPVGPRWTPYFLPLIDPSIAILATYLHILFTLMLGLQVEAECYSETPESIYNTRQCHSPEDHNLNNHHCGKDDGAFFTFIQENLSPTHDRILVRGFYCATADMSYYSLLVFPIFLGFA
jgi:hypothetical protein